MLMEDGILELAYQGGCKLVNKNPVLVQGIYTLE